MMNFECGFFSKIFVFGFAVVCSSLSAQEAVATNEVRGAEIAVEALVEEALQKNPELRFYEAEIEAAKAGRRAAGTLANPELSSSLGQKGIGSGALRSEGIAWSVSLMQPFEWPGRIGLRKAIANRDIELAEIGLRRFKLALAERVKSLGYGLFAQQEKAKATFEVANRLKELREVLVQRDPSGLTPLLETRVIEATELTMQKRASDAKLATETSLYEINQIRGVPADIKFTVAKTRVTFQPTEPTDALVSMALTNNFDIRLRAAELAQQGFKVGLAKNERYPAISVGPMFSEERAGDREQVVGVGLSFPLPIWNRNSAAISSAKARQVQAETLYYTTQRETERRVLAAALTYKTKLMEIAKWNTNSVEHFREAAELADRHYRLGAVPVATYVELQKQYLDALEGLFDTKKEALEASAQLELLIGLPLPLSVISEERK